MARESGSAGNVNVTPWNPAKALRAFEDNEVNLSRGFLRCTPQQWFPGLAAQWLPLSHALSVELKVLEIKKLLEIMPTIKLSAGYHASLDTEQVALLLDEHAATVLVSAFSPDGTDKANDVVLEYLARRTLGSLALSWSGYESSSFSFRSSIDPYSMEFPGYVQAHLRVNNESCSVWFGLGQGLVDRIDGLWRRQVRLRSKGNESSGEYTVELAQLGVPPSMLTQYVKSGTVIDLETVASDKAFLRNDSEQIMNCRLFRVKSKFGIELLQGPAGVPSVPKGTTRLSISLGKVKIATEDMAEILQPRALWESELSLTDHVEMVINGEKVASAQLGIYEGRFALTVL